MFAKLMSSIPSLTKICSKMSSDVATTLLTALNFGYRKSIANRCFNFLILLRVDSAENHRVDRIYKMVTRLGGGFNPSEKYARQIGSFRQGSG